LQSGTQAPPSLNLVLPLYVYTAKDVRGTNGEPLGIDTRVHVAFLGAGAAWVTNAKVLGANLGGSVVPLSFIKSRIEGPSLDVPGTLKFTDITVQPLQLGWHSKRADYVAGYSLFLPTGKWELGGNENAGLGMWSHDFQAGGTAYLDKEHEWSLSGLGTYELHSHKKDSDVKVGDILTVEGGLGRTFLKMDPSGKTPVPTRITSFGLVYYGQFKLTSDELGVVSPIAENRKDRVFGAGIEGDLILPQSGWLFGLRVEPEFGARNRTQGWTFLLSVANELKSLAKMP